MENELPEANLTEKTALFFGYRELFLIEGDSMLPTLKNGDFVLINPATKPKTGDIVCARHPYQRSVNIVKRIKEINAEGRYFLVGDNLSESNDSRSFGSINPKDVLGVAVCRYK